jgi:hypothetical protein
MEGGTATVICRVLIRASFEQNGNKLKGAISHGVMKTGPALIVGRIDVCPQFQETPSHMDTTTFARQM